MHVYEYNFLYFHVCGVTITLRMKKIAVTKKEEGLSFVKKSGCRQNGFFQPMDSTLDLQDEKAFCNMEKKKNQCLVITLPESLAEFPVRVETNPDCMGIMLNIVPDSENNAKYLFILNQSVYRKVNRDDVLWIEASGSYSIIHLRDSRPMIVSFNLSTVGRDLPPDDFVRIHRSYIVNMKNVDMLSGNSVWIGGRSFCIGRGYRKAFFSHFVFIGSRKNVEEERKMPPVKDSGRP